MDSLGTFFLEAREAQDLTFEQVATLTKIQATYVQALEEERFHALPQKVFTKGFVQTYARTLRLDEKEALRRFSVSAGTYYQKKEEAQRQVRQREEADRKGKANRNTVILLTGMILIGFVFILPREQSLSPSSQSNPSQQQKPEHAAESSILPAGSQVGPVGESASGQEISLEMQFPTPSANRGTPLFQVVSVSKPLPRTPLAPEKQAADEEAPVGTSVEPGRTARLPFEPESGEHNGPLRLELEAVEITWVVVRADDREPYEALLQPGAHALWRAHDRFLLTLGNAGGVKVTLNGEPRGPFGEHGTVVRHLELKP